jgi:hypothetical protein
MMSRIRDGNHIKPPRNLIDLIGKSREAQLRRGDRDPRPYDAATSVIDADSIKRGLSRLSAERVEDTLLAEAGDSSPLIERFRGKKSEYDVAALAAVLDVAPDDVASVAKPLVDLGFLEQIGSSYKIPILYRDGLDVIQGTAADVANA